MTHKEQAAVEWFFSELERMQYFIGNDMLEAYREAKEIEVKANADYFNRGFKQGLKTAIQRIENYEQ